MAHVPAVELEAGADVEVAVGVLEVVDAFEMSCGDQRGLVREQRTEVAREQPLEAVAVMTLKTDEQAASLRPADICAPMYCLMKACAPSMSLCACD